MKILHILDHSLPLHSGYTFRSQNLFKVQQTMGFKPIILTSPKHEQSLKKNTNIKENINGITYYRTGAVPESSMPFVTEVKMMYRLYRRIMAVAKLLNPDLIHAHSPVLNAIPAIWAGKKLNIPIVYEIRAFWEDAAVDHGTYQEYSWKYRLTQNIETWVCHKVDHICILCNGLKNDLVRRGIKPRKITPIFNGINPEELKPVPEDHDFIKKYNLKDKTIFGFIGSFYRYEGLDLLVRAFSKIAKLNEKAVLLLVGGGEVKEELRRLIDDVKIKNKVIMPGRIPHEKVPGVYALIDILVYPRYSMRLTELVTPLKPLEAMAMGKVLVASNVGGHRELIMDNKTGLLFEAGNVDALVEVLLKLQNNSDFCSKLQEKGYKWVRQNHTWEKTTLYYKNVYQSLASGR